MRILKFSYKDENWELKNLEFDLISLIVGRNATGKSRTLFYLNSLIKILKQSSLLLTKGEFNVKFQKDDSTIFSYYLKLNSGSRSQPVIISEHLKINDKLVLQRIPDHEAKILNVLTDNLDTINPPNNKLVIHVNRDVKKHPFLEDLSAWAEQSCGFKFASITTDFHNVTFETGISTIDDISSLFNALSSEDKSQVISELSQIGFSVEKLYVEKGASVDYLQVKEAGIENIIDEDELSQGMLRSIYLTIFTRFLISGKKTSTIIIDDLCEGLDYDRATKLGRMIFSLCQENNIQLIAASNDMFLMDVVELEYWNVLQREGSVVTALNEKNSPDLFESFKFTGLSNFDFFSSDFIPQKIER
jgi:ABC-type Na+ transport system ATPase subunit NatA